MTAPTSIDPTHLPATIRGFLTAHAAGDAATALRAFQPDAVVVDDGRTFRGSGEILDFLSHAAAEYTYTTELVGTQRVDDEHWVATNRLEGDFPGGVVELGYTFRLAGELVAELVIAPPQPEHPRSAGAS
jgi:hypothetical protein